MRRGDLLARTDQAVVRDATGRDIHALNVGTITITNSPVSGTASPSSITNDFEQELSGEMPTPINTTSTPAPGGGSPGSALSAAGTTSLGIPANLERRWLTCWTTFYFFALRYPPDAIVRDSLGPYIPQPGSTYTFHFNCGFTTEEREGRMTGSI